MATATAAVWAGGITDRLIVGLVTLDRLTRDDAWGPRGSHSTLRSCADLSREIAILADIRAEAQIAVHANRGRLMQAASGVVPRDCFKLPALPPDPWESEESPYGVELSQLTSATYLEKLVERLDRDSAHVFTLSLIGLFLDRFASGLILEEIQQAAEAETRSQQAFANTERVEAAKAARRKPGRGRRDAVEPTSYEEMHDEMLASITRRMARPEFSKAKQIDEESSELRWRARERFLGQVARFPKVADVAGLREMLRREGAAMRNVDAMRRDPGEDAPQSAKDQAGVVYLGSGRLNLGTETVSLEANEEAVIVAMLAHNGCSLKELETKSEVSRPGDIVRKLQRKYPKVSEVIIRPGKRGAGGYRTTIRDVRTKDGSTPFSG